jgi:hypothetical protein
MAYKPTTNLTNFRPAGALGGLFEKARIHNQLNDQLQELLEGEFKDLSLCLVDVDSVTLIAPNSALAYKANKQQRALLEIVQQIHSLSNTTKLLIKVNKKGF